MIQYIKRKDIDIEKYNSCIKNALQSRIYAFSWYLDIVADNWDVLVLNNYEAVMPIPWKRKYFLKYVTQPYFCQQLGVFSKKEIENSLKKKFLKKIPINIVYIDLFFNLKMAALPIKKNFTLKLDTQYSNAYQNYRKDRKKSLKKAIKANLSYQDFNNTEALINLYKRVFHFLKMPEEYFQCIDAIITYSIQNNIGFIRNVFFEDKLVCSGFFAKYNLRIYYLFAASSTEGKKYGATTYLINSIIEEYSNTGLVLDFEGSSISSIASFYKSFGGKSTNYFNYKSNVIKRIYI